MGLDSVEAFVIEHRLNETACRGIPIDGGNNVRTEDFAEHRLILERIIISLTDHG